MGTDRYRVLEALHTLYPHGRRGGFIEIRSIHKDFPPQAQFFENTGWSEVSTSIAEWVDGFDFPCNHYIGRALRREAKYGDTSNVDFISALSFDFDPVRPTGEAATEEEVVNAVSVAMELCRSCSLPQNILMSGNGAQIWCPLSSEVDIRGRKIWWRDAAKAFEDSIRLEAAKIPFIQEGKVRMDSQFDIPRIVKLAGTLSVKGSNSSDRPWRYAYFTSLAGGKLEVERVLSLATEDTTQGRRVTEGEVPSVPDRFWKLVEKDERLRKAWRGQLDDISDTSGSGQDCALAHKAKGYGFTPEETIAILMNSPGGKKRCTFGYAKHTVSKIFQEDLS